MARKLHARVRRRSRFVVAAIAVFVLATANLSSPLVASASDTFTISGHILNPSGGIAEKEVLVRLLTRDALGDVHSAYGSWSEGGDFSVLGVPEGDYYLKFGSSSLDSWASQFYSNGSMVSTVDIDSSTVVPVHIVSDLNIGSVRMKALQPRCISGHVDGLAGGAATVHVYGAYRDVDDVYGDYVVDDNGDYSACRLIPSVYRVVAVDLLGRWMPTYLGDVASEDPTSPIIPLVALDDDIRDGDISLTVHRSYRISGNINTEREIEPGQTASLYRSEGGVKTLVATNVVEDIDTDTPGHKAHVFSFTVSGPGEYLFEFDAGRYYMPLAQTFEFPAGFVDSILPVSWRESFWPIAAAPTTISGTIAQNGVSAPATTLFDVTSGEPRVIKTVTGSSFTFPVFPGRYRLVNLDEFGQFVSQTYPGIENGGSVAEVGLSSDIVVTRAGPVVLPEVALRPVIESAPTPVIRGADSPVYLGQVLSADVGAWLPSSVTLSYRWLRDGRTTGFGPTLELSNSHYAHSTITVEVTGALGYARSARVSASVSIDSLGAAPLPIPPVKTVQSAPQKSKRLTATPKPVVSGKTRVGTKLRVLPGKWKPGHVTLTYQWLRSGKKIPSATKTVYKITAKDKGKKISVAVTGSRRGYSSVTSISSAKKVQGRR